MEWLASHYGYAALGVVVFVVTWSVAVLPMMRHVAKITEACKVSSIASERAADRSAHAASECVKVVAVLKALTEARKGG